MKVFEETGTAPVPLRHPSRQAYRLQELERIAKRNALPITMKPVHWPTNPVPAMVEIIAAQSAGGGDMGRLSFALLRACWAEDKDIAQEDVIGVCLKEAGFNPEIGTMALLTGADVIERNTNEALERNVFGAPSYVVGDQVFWGQDRLAYLDDHLESL